MKCKSEAPTTSTTKKPGQNQEVTTCYNMPRRFIKVSVRVYRSRVENIRQWQAGEVSEESMIRQICGTAPRVNTFTIHDPDDDCCSWQSVYAANRVEVV